MKINKEKIRNLAEKYDLNMVLLFGSRVKDKKLLHAESDFDVAYLPTRNLKGEELTSLNYSLVKIFENSRVDTVNLKSSEPLLKHEIAQKSKLLFGEEMDYLEFKASAFKQYVDARPLLELEEKLIKKRQKSLKDFINA